MLNLDDSILILLSFLLFTLSVGGLDGLVGMGWCKCVKHPTSKNAPSLLFPQNPRAFTSSLAFSSTFVVWFWKVSPDRG